MPKNHPKTIICNIIQIYIDLHKGFTKLLFPAFLQTKSPVNIFQVQFCAREKDACCFLLRCKRGTWWHKKKKIIKKEGARSFLRSTPSTATPCNISHQRNRATPQWLLRLGTPHSARSGVRYPRFHFCVVEL